MTTLILSVFLAISASAYDIEINGMYYNLIKETKTAEVTYGDKRYSGEIIIPESITFKDTEISVSGIGESAFTQCYNLTSVTIPNSVTSIGNYAFSQCYNLTSPTIPNSVTSIGTLAFYNCSNLTSVTIPNSVTSIGEMIFSYCSNLTSVTIPNSVTSIGNGAFYYCNNLTSVTIPNSVTSIGENTFYNCSNLTSVTIPNSVTSIGSGAFYSCKYLKNVYCCAEEVPITETDAFEGAYVEYATLYVSASAIDSYKTTSPWKDFGTFKTLEGSEGETKKCETPTISFANGEVVYNCATEGVEYVSEIKSNDVNKFYTDKVSLSACYDISVTAMKTGYDNSDIATAKLYWLPSSGTLETDNINTAAMRGIAIQSAAGFINISGLDNNERVDFFGVDGKSLGSTKSINGSVSFSAQQGTVIIAKIGKESLKIAVE